MCRQLRTANRDIPRRRLKNPANLNFLDRGKLWGLMDSPDDQPFTPGRYTPLMVE